MIRREVIAARGMLKATDERLKLAGQLPRVIQRKAHAGDVDRAPARPLTSSPRATLTGVAPRPAR